MASTKISAATLVTVPDPTDEYATNQGGVSSRTTRAVMHDLEVGEHLILPQVNEAATPTLAFGDGDTGFHEFFDDRLELALGGVNFILFDGSTLIMQITGAIKTTNANGAGILNETASATNPTVLVRNLDVDTGLGSPGNDALSLVAGALDCINIAEVSGARQVGFYVTPPISLQTGVAVTSAGIHAALVNLGLITA